MLESVIPMVLGAHSDDGKVRNASAVRCKDEDFSIEENSASGNVDIVSD